MTMSLAEKVRLEDPLAWERTRLVVEASTALKLALHELGWTQSDLARNAHKSRAIVSRQLRGTENMSLGKLAELAYVLHKRVSIDLVDLPFTAVCTDDVSERQEIPWTTDSREPSVVVKYEDPTVPSVAA